MRPSHVVICFCLFCCSTSALGYKEYSHALISQAALDRSVATTDVTLLGDLGLGSTTRDPRFLLPFYLESFPLPLSYTPAALVFQGAIDEDAGQRSFNHFMDPQAGNIPLTIAGGALGLASVDWALESNDNVASQQYSYRDAKEYLYAALTGPTGFQRSVDLGSAFYALGHVAHHVQDMTQPQHVRNDDHCDDPGCRLVFAYKPSAYERYTYERGRNLPLAGYPVADYATYGTPLQLWRGAGRGIAEFTSANFVTVGTNFEMEGDYVVADTRHPDPTDTRIFVQRRQITEPDLLGPQGPNQPLAGEIWFIGTPVIDRYQPSEVLNSRTSTYSMFASDLEAVGRQAGFTLNRLNYAAANDFLLPRAAAYSTGLINYFFRGRIEIGLPADGVYGVVDHATTYAAGQGFGKLKLKLRNASPDGVKPSGEHVPQTMEGGTLVAIAKYTLNSCYTSDLTGDFGATLDTGVVIYPANCTLDQYFAGEEQISQSAAILGATLTSTAAEFTFNFDSQPIPVNARDLRIQVVYTGQLGAEADGIAFGGRDISEPTHVVVYNNSDYYAVDGKFYTPQQIRADATLTQKTQDQVIDPRALRDVSVAFAPGRFVAGPGTQAVNANGYLRVAVLADSDQAIDVTVRLRFDGSSSVTSTFGGVLPAVTDLRGESAYITPFGIWRGVRVHMVDVAYRANNDVALADDALAIMSTRDLPDPGPTPIPVGF